MVSLLLFPALGLVSFALILKLYQFDTLTSKILRYVLLIENLILTSIFFIDLLAPEVKYGVHLENLGAWTPVAYILVLSVLDSYLFKKAYFMEVFKNLFRTRTSSSVVES